MGIRPLPKRLLPTNKALNLSEKLSVRQSKRLKPCITCEGELIRQPSSSKPVKARKPPNVPLFQPADNSPFLRSQEPPKKLILTPVSSKPFFVRKANAPPNVFSPKSGLVPGNTSMPDKAFKGIKSQLTTSPKGSLSLTPSRNTDSPCGVPNCGDAEKPLKLISI